MAARPGIPDGPSTLWSWFADDESCPGPSRDPKLRMPAELKILPMGLCVKLDGRPPESMLYDARRLDIAPTLIDMNSKALISIHRPSK